MKRVLIACLLILNARSFLAAQTSAICNMGNISGRTCLTAMLDMYLKAMSIHKPAALQVSPSVKFTEDGVEKKLGEGLWKTFSRFRGAPTGIVVDVRQGVVVAFDVVEENSSLGRRSRSTTVRSTPSKPS